MPSIRVDGNDLFAVHDVTTKAREISISQNRPVLIEAMTYRGGHHSTSDDSSRYREAKEIQYWTEHNNPITRLRLYMESKGIWDSDQELKIKELCRETVLKAMSKAESCKKPPFRHLFTDVFDKLTPHLEYQQQQLVEHLKKYSQHYKLDDYADDKDFIDRSMNDRVDVREREEERDQKIKEGTVVKHKNDK